VDYPQNSLTQMIEEAARANRAGGGMPVRRQVEVASATSMPTVQSAAVGRPVEEPPPLTAEEREELDRQAILAGVLDPRLGNQNTDGTPINTPTTAYGSLEEAIAAGAPVNQPAPAVDPVENFRGDRAALVAVREKVRVMTGAPRVPDFRKVEGIDLINNAVVVDGLTFPLSAEQALELRQMVVETARAAIMEKLDEAMKLFTEAMYARPEASDGSEAVLPVQDGEASV
jgi:hypothetical protein